MEGITTLFFFVKILLLLPLLLGFSVPAIAHNEANGGEVGATGNPSKVPFIGGYVTPPFGDEEGEEGIDRENTEAEIDRKQGLKGEGI